MPQKAAAPGSATLSLKLDSRPPRFDIAGLSGENAVPGGPDRSDLLATLQTRTSSMLCPSSTVRGARSRYWAGSRGDSYSPEAPLSKPGLHSIVADRLAMFEILHSWELSDE